MIGRLSRHRRHRDGGERTRLRKPVPVQSLEPPATRVVVLAGVERRLTRAAGSLADELPQCLPSRRAVAGALDEPAQAVEGAHGQGVDGPRATVLVTHPVQVDHGLAQMHDVGAARPAHRHGR